MIKKYPPRCLTKDFLNTALFLIIISTFIFSCKVYKPVYFFKDITKDTIITGFTNPGIELKIQKDDILSIGITSLSPVEDALFNSNVGGAGASAGYLVEIDGSIYLHKLGKITVTGMTRKELKNRLEKDLLPYLKDPIVNINFLNHKITFLGETGSQVLTMPEEKISLIDVMAKSAAVTSNTRLNNVLVIRDIPNAKQFKHLNLEDPSIFTSPWYYLQPNDIVVVKPNEEKIFDEQRRVKNQQLFATVISAISFSFIIIDRIARR